MIAHDGVASTLPEDSTTPTPSTAETITQSLPDCYREDNIKIIKIEKSTEPLGATVRNEGDAVVIGMLFVCYVGLKLFGEMLHKSSLCALRVVL